MAQTRPADTDVADVDLSDDWDYAQLRLPPRRPELHRATRSTDT